MSNFPWQDVQVVFYMISSQILLLSSAVVTSGDGRIQTFGGTLEILISETATRKLLPPGTYILESHASFGWNMSPCMCSNTVSPLLPHSGAVAPLRLQQCLL